VEVSAGTRRTIARPKGDRLLRSVILSAAKDLMGFCRLRLRGPVHSFVGAYCLCALQRADRDPPLPSPRLGPARRHPSASGGIGVTRLLRKTAIRVELED